MSSLISRESYNNLPNVNSVEVSFRTQVLNFAWDIAQTSIGAFMPPETTTNTHTQPEASTQIDYYQPAYEQPVSVAPTTPNSGIDQIRAEVSSAFAEQEAVINPVDFNSFQGGV